MDINISASLLIVVIIVEAAFMMICTSVLYHAWQTRKEVDWIVKQRIVITVDDDDHLMEVFGRFSKTKVDVISIDEYESIFGDEWRSHILNDQHLAPFIVATDDNKVLRVVNGNYFDNSNSGSNNGRYCA